MNLGFEGKAVIVTGGASNIGRATSMAFAREGAVVAIFDRDGEQAKRTADSIVGEGGACDVFTLDVMDADALAMAVAKFADKRGGPLVVVNNVGWAGPLARFLDIPPTRWRHVLELNLLVSMTVTHAVLPRMIASGGGALVHVASDAAFGDQGVSEYSAAKGALLSFSRSIAFDYGRDGVRSNVVAPGFTAPASEDAIGADSVWRDDLGYGEKVVERIRNRSPLKSLPVADDVADTIVFLASQRARMLTGQLISVSGGVQMPR